MNSLAYADRTIAAYRSGARKAIQNWRRRWKPSRFLREFTRSLPRGGAVLDYGCGIGTDMAWLSRQGFKVEGIDGSLEFVLEARRRCPDLRVAHGRFETTVLRAGQFDGIWCNAALIHVPPAVFQDQLKKLFAALKPNGILGLTLAWGRAKRFTSRDWIPGRYMAGYTKEEAIGFFRHRRLRKAHVVSGDGRQGRWIQVLACA